MRKFLMVAAVGALVLLVAAPAMALDFKFGAEYRVRFTTGVNVNSASNVFLNDRTDPPQANSNPRSIQLRVRPRFDASDDNGNITATWRAEIGDIEFGDNGGATGETNGVAVNNGASRVGNGGGGGFGADGVNVETKWAYLDFALPFGLPLRVRAGLQPWFLPKGLIVDDDAAGVRAYGTVKPISYEAFWYRLLAGPLAVNNLETKDNNFDIYGGKIDVAIAPFFNPGAYYFYADNRVNCTNEGATLTGVTQGQGSTVAATATCADRVRQGHWVGATVTGKAGIVSYDFDFVYGSAVGGPNGNFSNTGSVANPTKVKGYAFDAGVHVPVGPITLNVAGSYASGDKRDGGDSEAFPSLAASWNGPSGGFEMVGSGGVFDQVEFTQDSPVNLWTLGGWVTYNPVKALTLKAGYLFAHFARKNGNCANVAGQTDPNVINTPCFGPVYRGAAGESTLGHEFHLRADYDVWTGFKLMGQVGWLVPSNNKTAAEYVFQMLYNF